MSSECDIKLVDKIYYLAGRMGEGFRQKASIFPTEGEIKINLKDLVSINSSGIREWVVVTSKMKAAKILLFECPKAFIDQVNMVKDFAPTNATIMSFYVPYFNESNDAEKNVLYVLNKNYGNGKVTVQEKIVDEKGDEMELDVIEAKYFKFIKG